MRIETAENRDDELISKLAAIWRRSVEMTHCFLSHDDIDEIGKVVPGLLMEVPQLIVAYSSNGSVGFAGVDGSRLEMLFLDPQSIGMGYGRCLIEYVTANYGVDELTVNEDNHGAVGFYHHMGFSEYRRTELDEQGRPFPLLYMKLSVADGSGQPQNHGI